MKPKAVWGLTNAESLYFIEDSINSYTPFVPENKELRLNPKTTMPGAKSIVVLGLSYSSTDYHNEVKNLLLKLANRLGLENFNIFTDTGPLADRALAFKAGLGFYGRNLSIISPVLGSCFNIGYLMTDMEFPHSAYCNREKPMLAENCNKCFKCVCACPGKALSYGEKPELIYEKCASYLTQKKGILTKEEMEIIGTNIYGCNICQMVCPYNSHIIFENKFSIETAKHFLRLSNSQFTERYKNSDFFWRGLKTIKRNALIALGNCNKKQAIEIIENFINRNDETLRNAAEYALGKYK